MSIKVNHIKTNKPKKSHVIKVKGKLSDLQKEQFYADLHTLLKSRIDLEKSLELLQGDQKKINQLIQQIQFHLLNGKSFSESLKATKKFSQYEFHSITVGENSGELAQVVDNLSKYFKKKNELRKQIISVLSYPSFVFFVAVGVIIFLMNFVVPMFGSVLGQLNVELPKITQFLISISEWFGEWFQFIIITSLVFIGLLYSQKNSLWFKKMSSQILLRLPKIGSMLRQTHMARFCEAVSLMLSAKLGFVQTLELAEEMISFHPIHISINSIRQDILSGKGIWESFKKHKIYDSRMLTMIKLGEEVNELDLNFKHLAENYSKNVDHESTQLKSIVEPLVIVLVGTVVAVVALALILPVFKASSSLDF